MSGEIGRLTFSEKLVKLVHSFGHNEKLPVVYCYYSSIFIT